MFEFCSCLDIKKISADFLKMEYQLFSLLRSNYSSHDKTINLGTQCSLSQAINPASNILLASISKQTNKQKTQNTNKQKENSTEKAKNAGCHPSLHI